MATKRTITEINDDVDALTIKLRGLQHEIEEHQFHAEEDSDEYKSLDEAERAVGFAIDHLENANSDLNDI